jgi:hypothetical protein
MVYSSIDQQDVMSNDIGNVIYNPFRGANISGFHPSFVYNNGDSCTVNKYTSKKKHAEDGAWQHEEIVLKPLNPDCADMVIPNTETEEFVVGAEVVAKF